MTAADLARASIVVVAALVLQHAVLDAITVGGAHPDVTLLLPVAAGYSAGPERGAIFGFCAGLAADLLLPTTFGLSALVGCILGYLTGVATASLVRSSWWLPPIIFALATAAGLCGYAILGTMLGQNDPIGVYLPPALVIATPAAAILALPVLRAVAWAVPAPAPSQQAQPGTGLR